MQFATLRLVTRFSKTNSSRKRRVAISQRRRCRIGTVMARILPERPISRSSPSHSVCGPLMFWRMTTLREAKKNETNNQMTKSPTSFSGTTHTQGAAEVGEGRGVDEPPTAAGGEVPHGTRAFLGRSPHQRAGQPERFPDFECA